MFAKSKIAAPLVALLVACMAVEAAPVVTVPLPESCICPSSYQQIAVPDPKWGGYDYISGGADNTKQVCTRVGQANGAVFNGTSARCDIATQSGYDSYVAGCADSFVMDPLGDLHYGVLLCHHQFPDVPPPQVCTCTDPSGVNTTAQTNYICTGLAGNIGTMFGDKCLIENQHYYQAYSNLCYQVYPGSNPD
ncbi:hypothetical protein BGZ98_001870, partial [Dissophora globulifera]